MNCYPISGLFFYRAIFIAWLLLAEAMFLYPLERRKNFLPRVLFKYVLCFGAAFGFPIPTGNAFYTMFMFLILYLVTVLTSMFCYQSGWRAVFFATICGYTIEHIGYETYFAAANFSGALGYGTSGLYDNDSLALFTGALDEMLYFLCYILVYWLAFVFFGLRVKKGITPEFNDNFRALALGAFFVLIDIVLNSAVSFYGSIHYERIFMGFVAVLNVGLCLVALLLIFELSYKNAYKKSLSVLEQLRKQEKDQYALSKETIDMINIKCHDLKHQIRSYGAKEQIPPKAIENLSNLIEIYDSTMQTGNSALNTILTEKKLFCQRYDIRLSCIADGFSLAFMAEEDIYSLFGNLIDNAVEAVKELPKEQKTITLHLTTKGNMISVSIRNPYQGDLHFRDDLPITKKEDKGNHGYGLRSVRMIVERYGGQLKIDGRDHVFRVFLLFFKANEKKTGK